MGGVDTPRDRAGFHEMPLVFFTALAIAGAGAGSGHLMLGLFTSAPWLPPRDILGLSGGLLVLGLLVSMLHLGRPIRGRLALSRIGRSPLSTEVLVVLLAVVASLVSALLPPGHDLVPWLSSLALLAMVLTLLALGRVYVLPHQLTWSGGAGVHPLIMGLVFGGALFLGSSPGEAEARGELLVLFLLFLDGFLVWFRMRRLERALMTGVPARPRLVRWRGSGWTLRILLGDLLPALAVLLGEPALAPVSLSVNLIVDRMLFYGMAVQASTEAQVLRVENALRRESESPVEPVGFP